MSTQLVLKVKKKDYIRRSVGLSVHWSVTFFWFQAVFVLLPLPNRPLLSCRVYGLVSEWVNAAKIWSAWFRVISILGDRLDRPTNGQTWPLIHRRYAWTHMESVFISISMFGDIFFPLWVRQWVIREIRSHCFSVINSRDNSQKIRIQPGRTKKRQQFLSSFIIISAPFWN